MSITNKPGMVLECDKVDNELVYRRLLQIEDMTGLKMNKGKKDEELVCLLFYLVNENKKLANRLDEMERKK